MDSPNPLDDPSKELQPHKPYAAFAHRAYRFYVASFSFATLASQMLVVSLQWQIHTLVDRDEQRSALMLGVLGGIGALPVIFLSIFAGQLADRRSRKRVLLVMQGVLIFCPLVLGVLAVLERLNLPWLFGFSLLNALALTFARPTRSALLATLVPYEDFPNAVTWNSTIFETSSVIGPAIGGIIIAHVPGHVGASLLISAALMTCCAVCTLFLPDRPRAQGIESLSWKSLSAGLHFVYQNKLMLAVMMLDLFAVLLAGALYLLPVFAERLNLGPMGFAGLRAAPAVGAISMALIQAHLPPFRRAGRAMLLAVAGFAGATIVFGFSQSFHLSLLMLFFTGVFDNISVVVRSSIVQMLTPDSMRGRVSAVNFIFVGASNELGGLESGLTARYFGPVRSVVGGGIAALGVVLVIAWKFPQVRRLGRLRELHIEPRPLALPPEVEVRGTDT